MATDEASLPAARTAGSGLALAAAGVTVLLWASAFVAIRQAGHELSAGALTLGRLAVGSVVLGVLASTRRRIWPSRREWGLLIVCGVGWFGVYNLALNEAERHIDAGIAAMLVNVGPILIALLAGMLLGEGFPRGLIGGGLLAFAGVVIIGVSTARDTHADVWGVVLCMVAAVSYAVGVVSQKPVLRHLPAITVTWLACLIGATVSLPFLPALVHDLGHAQASTVALVVYLGAFPTAIAFTTWAYALSHTTAGRMGATTYLVPPIAIVMGWILLGEPLPALAAAGGVLALGGVAVTRRR